MYLYEEWLCYIHMYIVFFPLYLLISFSKLNDHLLLLSFILDVVMERSESGIYSLGLACAFFGGIVLSPLSRAYMYVAGERNTESWRERQREGDGEMGRRRNVSYLLPCTDPLSLSLCVILSSYKNFRL